MASRAAGGSARLPLLLAGLAALTSAQPCAPGSALIASVCTPCSSSSFSFGGASTSCATCATSVTGETFISAAAGCAPPAPPPASSLAGALPPAIYVTGADAAALGGIGVPSTQAVPVVAADSFGRASAAIKTTVEYYNTGALPQLPSGNGARTLAAFVKCAAPSTAQGPTILELGDPSNSPLRQVFSLRGGGAQTPSSVNVPQYSISTVAGSPPPLMTALTLDGTGTNANFNNIVGLKQGAVTGNLYVGERSGYRVRMVVPSTGVVTTLAGSSASSAYVDAQGTNARFGYVTDVQPDPTETFLLICDLSWNRIRKLDLASGNVSTLIGNGAGFADGVGTAAQLSGPSGLAIDANADGTIKFLYIAEQAGNRIRKVNFSSLAVTTIGGQTGVASPPGGFALNTGSGANITSIYNLPKGITLTPDRSALFVLEQTSTLMRRINLTTLADSVFVGGVSAALGISSAVAGCAGCGVGGMWSVFRACCTETPRPPNAPFSIPSHAPFSSIATASSGMAPTTVLAISLPPPTLAAASLRLRPQAPWWASC